ncbi:MAG TPA: L,D-transpeptidase family protein [Steroidobacteraceae bacterium]|nr:L,D-transpeptidase family protein [Steroidobacteraceae bacterium]
MPGPQDAVVGETQVITAKYEDTLGELGRRHGIGYEEIVRANPGVNPWLPGSGTQVTIPARFILPEAPRVGIVINLPEHRLYYYPIPKKGDPAVVVTYPISVGKMDWTTPLGLTRIVDKRVKPSWYPPESVRREHEEEGDPLPKVVPPGPDNPLGEYAMRLDIPGGAYLIHGTNKPIAVGMPVTHGCIRMFPEDIERFFAMVPVKTPVRIMHQPNKAGWQGDKLYMEVHPQMEGDPEAQSLTNVTRMLVAATRDRENGMTRIDWAQAESIFRKASGVAEPMVTSETSSSGARLLKGAELDVSRTVEVR